MGWILVAPVTTSFAKINGIAKITYQIGKKNTIFANQTENSGFNNQLLLETGRSSQLLRKTLLQNRGTWNPFENQ